MYDGINFFLQKMLPQQGIGIYQPGISQFSPKNMLVYYIRLAGENGTGASLSSI